MCTSLHLHRTFLSGEVFNFVAYFRVATDVQLQIYLVVQEINSQKPRPISNLEARNSERNETTGTVWNLLHENLIIKQIHEAVREVGPY